MSIFAFFSSFQNLAYADFSTSRISQTIASESNVFVTWDRVSNSSTSIMFTKSSDNGNSFGKTVEIANDLGISSERKMAVSGNNVYIVWGSYSGNQNGIFLRKSSDYGNTFAPVSILSAPNKICPSVTGLVATGPYVYVFFNCYNPTSSEGSIMFRASHDYANTFGEEMTLFQGRSIYTNLFLSTAAEGENVYIIAEKDYDISNPDNVLFRKSTDGGITFGAAVDLSDNRNSHVFPQVISNGNHVYVIWRDYYDNNFKDLIFRKSDDYGNTFGNATKLNKDKQDTEMYNQPFLSFKDDGKVYVSWEEIHQSQVQTQYQLLRISEDGGNNFGPEKKITDTLSMRYDLSKGGIALGSGQNIYYLWSGPSDPTFDINGIFFKMSQDGGITFAKERDLNKLNSNPRDMSNPQITVSGNDVYITGDTQDRGQEIFFVASHDNGTSFSKIININDHNLAGQVVKTRTVESPLKQLKAGIRVQDIKCREGLELIIRLHDNSPACVRHVNLPRLLTNGWIYAIDTNAELASKTTQQVVTIGDKINDSNGLVPITTTEITNNAELLDTITVWGFQPIGYNGDNIRTTWDFLPNSYSKFFEVVDEHDNSVIDTLRMPEPFGVPADLHLYPAICDSIEKVEGESGHPMSIPIKKGIPQVFAKNANRGILPDSDGKYTMKFVSLFETKVEFPKNAKIIFNETKSCFLEHKLDNFTKAFYTKVIFKLD